MLNKTDVFAVVVTYNPQNDLYENIESLVNQVNEIVIIDNNSRFESLLLIKQISKKYNINVIYNHNNMGIAYALNQGLELAKTKNYKLFLTMDQDSCLDRSCIEKMLNVLNINNTIVSVGPNYNNKINEAAHYKIVEYLITSGNLTYTDKAVGICGYTNKLFIDSVDFDFSLKLRQKGGILALVYNAKMDHKIGEILYKRIFGLNLNFTIHSPLRHYYMYRNHYYIIKKYYNRFSLFCLKKELLSWKYFFEVLCFYPNKVQNLKMIFRGIVDAFKSKYGIYSN